MKQWLSRMKLAHKMVLGFLGLIALPFTLLSVFSFASVASHYEHQLAQDGQYMLNMVVSDVNEKMDHVVTRPLSSRHFLWTPVMRYKHNGLPLGFVLS